MQVIEQNFAFCVANLTTTEKRFADEFCTNISRLIIGNNCYNYTHIIEVIFVALGKIVPFEISNMLNDSLIAIDDKENVIYNLV